jgi:hypothetical protein
LSNFKAIALPSDQEIGLDRYADLLAHTLHFRATPSNEVLARLRVPGNRWAAAHAKWTRFLIDEATEDEAPLARRFGAAFAATRARLRAEQPTIESIGSLPVVASTPLPEAVFAELEPLPLVPSPPLIAAAPSLPPAIPVEPALPSYMLVPNPSTQAPTAPAFSAFTPLSSMLPLPARVLPARHGDLGATANSSTLPIRPATPFNAGVTPEETLAEVVARMTAAQGAPMVDGASRPHAQLGETVGLTSIPAGSALPFGNNNPAVQPAPSWMPAGMMKLVSVDGTQLSSDAPTGPALPFAPARNSQIALDSALAQAARLQGPGGCPESCRN